MTALCFKYPRGYPDSWSLVHKCSNLSTPSVGRPHFLRWLLSLVQNAIMVGHWKYEWIIGFHILVIVNASNLYRCLYCVDTIKTKHYFLTFLVIFSWKCLNIIHFSVFCICLWTPPRFQASTIGLPAFPCGADILHGSLLTNLVLTIETCRVRLTSPTSVLGAIS